MRRRVVPPASDTAADTWIAPVPGSGSGGDGVAERSAAWLSQACENPERAECARIRAFRSPLSSRGKESPVEHRDALLRPVLHSRSSAPRVRACASTGPRTLAWGDVRAREHSGTAGCAELAEASAAALRTWLLAGLGESVRVMLAAPAILAQISFALDVSVRFMRCRSHEGGDGPHFECRRPPELHACQGC